ncbi:Mth938-like domain-containing protein [Rhodovibrio salinarum]|uniref:Mth938-like domain-containing protein n=1 Tax=Rhodovibrio salinarum TaxID=1087 RepID=A0A934V0E4_9PROT|nr:Mth938-like domain-containing protein [Rhodovibrio salinarum]MBK1697753.1 hypothetical protein [Rhodovibrio salinarum]
MDVTPEVPQGKQIVQSYGDGRFTISGEVYEGSVLVFPDRVVPWPVSSFDEVTLESLQAVTAEDADVGVLLLGCGQRMQLVTKNLRDPVREAGVVIEPMDTGAAARTFNVLLMEERRVAAALLAV